MSVKNLLRRDGLGKSDFRNLFQEYFEQIKLFVYYKTGDESSASDITQEVFLKIWEMRKEVKKDTVVSLLYSMANNIFISQWRRNKVVYQFEPKENTDSLAASPEETYYYQETKRLYENAISRMPDTYREVFLMSRMEELKYKEIAERLQISIKTVEKRMNRALLHLKHELRPVLAG